jgi:ABC-type sugar transport system substrate-binding protein
MKETKLSRRGVIIGALMLGVALGSPVGVQSAAAQALTCPPAQRVPFADGIAPANKRIAVSVAYLGVPFYANYKLGLEDAAKQFGFTYDLFDGNLGDLATEIGNLQNIAAQKYDMVLLTPSGAGILPAIKQLNEAGVPIIEVNNKAGFGNADVDVITYVGADDVEFGRLQVQLVADHFKGEPVKVAYVMGPLSSPAQVLRAQGWDEAIVLHPEITEIARVSDDFDSAKGLAVVQDLLSRFPAGEIDVIVMQGPEGGAAVENALRSQRDDVVFFSGDYPADIRQFIYDGKIAGTVNQDPYPQAFHAMEMAHKYFTGQEADIQKPFYLPLPLITQENAEAVPPAWGC